MTNPKRGDIIRYGSESDNLYLVVSPEKYNKSKGLISYVPLIETSMMDPFILPVPGHELSLLSTVIQTMEWTEDRLEIVEQLDYILLEEVMVNLRGLLT